VAYGSVMMTGVSTVAYCVLLQCGVAVVVAVSGAVSCCVLQCLAVCTGE